MLAGFPLLAALLAPSDGVEAVARWMHELDGRVPEARAIVTALAPHGEIAAEALVGLLGEEPLPGWQRTLATVPSACASQLAQDATGHAALQAFGIAIASRFGDDQAVAPLLALCLAGAPKSLEEDSAVDRFATSLCRIAEREPHALGSSTLDRVPQEWRAPLAARLGRSARPEAAPWLLSLLSGDPTVEPTALLALARLARALEGALVLDEVQERRVLFCLDSGEATTRSAAAQAVGRLDLVDAVFDEANPFPARVMANRVWHHLFGRGLVGTTDDFGGLGETPTDPELLDFLASRLRDDWSVKNLIRSIVRSSERSPRPKTSTS